MNIERNDELQWRAAKHAALSDPARLRIVDLLTVGELAPSEISDSLTMRSNLVTHHLNVLESVGMLTRHRSEADKRRSYVRLTEHALEGLVPGAVGSARRVLFVCTANSARSQLAVALWNRVSSIPAASAGTHPAEQIASGAIATAARHSLTLPGVRPQALPDVLAAGDFVVTVCDNAHEELGLREGAHWSIPDPVRIGTDAAFDAVLDDLQHRIDDLAPRLVAS
ncbi:ArsR family transcriptional regulator [Agreia sp. Leaf244]|uniref:Transcriptional regulator, ArsR family n=1 Tax=Agreia pratensis TaxID=150121 RepID=A0A1X7J7H8_9MICO|nr:MULTISPECIES: helix-turn-helix domain-containing protein [Agreia]KQO09888.1 ArsR family transcriptional regulator [Agreia sp. Leaf244]SMG23470.1 transcriptional regulator, ArsR family [Agreia pratensis]